MGYLRTNIPLCRVVDNKKCFFCTHPDDQSKFNNCHIVWVWWIWDRLGCGYSAGMGAINSTGRIQRHLWNCYLVDYSVSNLLHYLFYI